ncbi:MAG: DUF885 domain-containing protein [Candidatus Pedobacter colombiensis]|uniref:DUF885 domain-containing protein n=1 Tax=Candidatus Pedobacter colombiensis TaxID=3121371 RepID=A0AAJ5WCE9_9SPHI|nr:DUF885 domain-containing protein [Pedobacter sp.]WEK20909.1 MAG: DUF885 domain-containing protein [Pedobacter sp.]
MMNKLILLFASVLFISGGCKDKKAEILKNSKDIAILFDAYWEKNSKFFPLDATSQGDNRYNDQLPNDGTQAFRDSLKNFYQDYLTKIERFNPADLNNNDKISYDIFKYDLQVKLEGLKWNTWMMPINQFSSLPLTIGQLGSGEAFQPFKTVKDYENWLGRIKGFSIWVDTAIANFRYGMAAGVVLPKPLVEKMIPQMTAMIVTNPEKSLFYDPLRKMPNDFSAADKARITIQYKQAILDEIVPAYAKLGTFFKDEYLSKARTTDGISAIPDGKDIYKYDVKYWTTTDKTPEEIYQTGLTEVKRIRNEMDSVKNKVGFKGSLTEFFTYLKTDPKFTPYKSPKEVLAAFNAIYDKIKPQLTKLYGKVPKTPFEIRQTEAFRAASASAEYMPGSPDGSRPGIFYIPILDASKFNITSGMESLFLHEAIPGHHYQISLQQENKDLPKFRRFAWYGAMGEGYALYSESLGKELGLYTDPYQYMGALGDEMHRAVRLVVDVAIHTRNMSREEAIKYMMSNEAISEDAATAEIERYMALPAQALSYKIGALKIRALRSKYQKELGAKFKIVDFHDEILKDGLMPLSVLEQKMDAWAQHVKEEK